jgi:hypothetical protein
VDKDIVDTTFMHDHGMETVGDPQARAEGVPLGVGIALDLCGSTGDGMAACRVCSAKSMEEIASGGRWCSAQGVGCEWCCSNKERKAVSERCWSREVSSAMMLTLPGRK